MKRMICLLLSVLMLLSMAACGGSTGGSDESGADGYVNKYSDRPKSVTLCYYEGGYGVEWLRAVTADYMDNINQDVYISMKASHI